MTPRTRVSLLATEFARALHLFHPRKDRGCREGRVAACTRGPRARKIARARVNHRYSGDTPAFPAQRFTAYSALSSVNLRCHRRQREAFGASRGLSACMCAPGPHGFAIRVRAARQSAQPTSAAFRSTFVTIAIRPLCRCGVGAVNHVFRKIERRIFLGERLDRPNQLDAACEIRFLAQARGTLGQGRSVGHCGLDLLRPSSSQFEFHIGALVAWRFGLSIRQYAPDYGLDCGSEQFGRAGFIKDRHFLKFIRDTFDAVTG